MQKHRQSANIHRESAETEQVGRDAREFAADYANELAARRQLFVNAEQLLHREGVGDVVSEWGQIIQAVGVRNELGIGHVLGDFFIAAMEVTHIRHSPGDDLSIQLQQDPQHAVRGRM